ncbi:hypothetical protein CFH99_01810 [Nocardioides aromaticivorans]|uniref:DUF6924 domain-containing protein n=1 Tax=Nocardioides aromaticivorans TaxID=200618 RepID=A0ABX7PEN7_9ACTN|nr:hypothetical protein [Nocardioides aromaticivorans]QSR24359.1 hypothetical protein CFH99_01810 [Nocardioides aromaticivorans]
MPGIDGLTTILEAALPRERLPLIRVDFSDPKAWRRLAKAVATPVDFSSPIDNDPDDFDPGYSVPLDVIDDPAFAGITAADLVHAAELSEAAGMRGYAILVDTRSVAEAAGDGGLASVEIVDLARIPGQTFLCLATSVATVHANLSTGNLFFDEFTTGDEVFDG